MTLGATETRIILRIESVTCMPQFLTEGALGPIRNRKTEKPKKKTDQNRKPHEQLSKPIHFHIPVFKTVIDPIQW